jgi:penicillin-binding protein 1A
MASRFILTKRPLNLHSEAATFVAMLENPRKNNPTDLLKKQKEEEMLFWIKMQKTGYIDQATL